VKRVATQNGSESARFLGSPVFAFRRIVESPLMQGGGAEYSVNENNTPALGDYSIARLENPWNWCNGLKWRPLFCHNVAPINL
jgi:hypothetical protein